ncbi:MAG: hypothetical protein ACYCQJ_01445 [Nitrososphaerales archaeon]
MTVLYQLTRSSMFLGGMILIGYGSLRLSNPFVLHISDPLWLFGIFPIYVGAMLILVSLAMKEDWFTNARRYW